MAPVWHKEKSRQQPGEQPKRPPICKDGEYVRANRRTESATERQRRLDAMRQHDERHMK